MQMQWSLGFTEIFPEFAVGLFSGCNEIQTGFEVVLPKIANLGHVKLESYENHDLQAL